MSSLHGIGGVTPPRAPSIRRASSNLTSTSAMPSKSPLSTALEEPLPPPPLNAASLAREHFEKELEAHHQPSDGEISEKIIVIVHDACYGHRYSRPRTSKANLSTIVERPERIQASILGISTAYVRLGDRHAEGKYAPHPKKDPKLLKHVPFRIRKSSRTMGLTSPAVTSVHGTRWMEDLKIMCDTAETKLALNGKELARPAGTELPSSPEKPKLHEGDLYLCSESLSAFEGALGGVCDGVDAVFQRSGQCGPNRAFVCIRPPGHHCSSNFPSGFCWINNVHVGIAHASMTYGLTHAAIIDFDLHHGDGSQAISWTHNSRIAALPKNAAHWKRSPIGYFSLHDINSYPCEMGDEEKVRNASLCLEDAHGQSIWNIHLQPWKTDAEFWKLYESRYSILLDKARNFLKAHTQRLLAGSNRPVPKAAIFLSAGFDASEWESPGMQRHKVNVPTDFYARFTKDIVKLSEEEGLGVEGRIVSVLEGGYSDRALTSGIMSHLSGLAGESLTGLEEKNTLANGLGYEMGKRMGVPGVNSEIDKGEGSPTGAIAKFESAWWAPSCLEELEVLINPPPAPPAPRKGRNLQSATYTSPTQSFTAKIVSAPKERRSLSGLASLDLSRSPAASVSRAPSPPPPHVDWATASYELSKLLIPSDRQIRSCKPEELNAEASRARRDRHSTIGVLADTTVPEGNRMQLRDRKTKPPNSSLTEEDEEKVRPVSRTSRRKTIGGAGLAPDTVTGIDYVTSVNSFRRPTEQSRRRLSVASSIGSVNSDKPDVTNVLTSNRQVSSNLSALAADRSISSTSIRPESSISNHTAVNSSVVKKSRVASESLVDVPKLRKREPPVPRIPSGYSRLPTTSEPEATNQPRRVEGKIKISSVSHGQVENQDVDELASSMKKISLRLKVPSKAEQEAREARKIAEKKKPLSKAPRKSAAPRIAKGAASSKTHLHDAAPELTEIGDAESAVNHPGDGTKAEEEGVNATVLAGLGTRIRRPEFPESSSTSGLLDTLSFPSTIANNIQHEESKIQTIDMTASKGNFARSASETAPNIDQNPSLFPNATETTLPLAKRTKEELPHFTTSSPIPFSNANSHINHPVQAAPAPAPSLPAQSHFEHAETARAGSPMDLAMDLAPSHAPGTGVRKENGDYGRSWDEEGKPVALAVDIWDVPETPNRH